MHPFYSSRWPRFLQVSRMVLVVSMTLAIFQLAAHAQGKERPVKEPTSYRTIQVDGLSIFYREAGPKDAPTLLLLHGLPSSSRMFEPLFTRLSDRYHLIAPDYPGFGHSDWPDPKHFAYTFDHQRCNHESLNGIARPFALHAVHAGLRWPRGFSHGLGTSGSNRGSHRPGCCGAQRRPGRDLEDASGLLGRPRSQRECTSHQPAVAADDADAPCRKRSQRATV